MEFCHAGLKNGLGLATLCPLLDTRTLYYTYAGRQIRVKRKKDGAGEKALRAPGDENVRSKYRNRGEDTANLEPPMRHQKEGGGKKKDESNWSSKIRNEKGPDDLPSA